MFLYELPKCSDSGSTRSQVRFTSGCISDNFIYCSWPQLNFKQKRSQWGGQAYLLWHQTWWNNVNARVMKEQWTPWTETKYSYSILSATLKWLPCCLSVCTHVCLSLLLVRKYSSGKNLVSKVMSYSLQPIFFSKYSVWWFNTKLQWRRIYLKVILFHL